MLRFKTMKEQGQLSLIMGGASAIIQLSAQLRGNGQRKRARDYEGFPDFWVFLKIWGQKHNIVN